MDGFDAFKHASSHSSGSLGSRKRTHSLRIPFFPMGRLPIAVTACRDIAEILVARGLKKSWFHNPPHVSSHPAALAWREEGSTPNPWIRFYIVRPSPVARGFNSPLACRRQKANGRPWQFLRQQRC